MSYSLRSFMHPLCGGSKKESNDDIPKVFIHQEYKTSESGSLVIVCRPIFPDSLSSLEDMKYMKDYINEETKEEQGS